MSYPYDEGQVIAFIGDADNAYAAAGQTWNSAGGVWVGRMQFDAVTMGYPASRQKHLAALQTALGTTPTPRDPGTDPGPTPVPPGQFVQAPRAWNGQMCGIHVPGLPLLSWGPPDPTLVLSWLYDRYSPGERDRIRAGWKHHPSRYVDVVLSWPDARAFGHTPVSFRNIVVELLNDGFHVCVQWCSKDFDAPDVPSILAGIEPAVQQLIGILPRCCIGWELSLWLSPTQVQQLIDAIAPRFVAYGCRVYVHFQQGYSSYQQENKFFADFWKMQVGKLTGTLHQRILGTTPQEYREASGGLQDVLERFAGHYFVPPDSGFGHPFDLVAWELTAMDQCFEGLSESEGDTWGTWALRTPRSTGPAGVVGVIGTGNGRLAGEARVTAFSRQPRPGKWRGIIGPLIDLNARG